MTSTDEITYATEVRSFDHSQLATLPANQADMTTLGEFLDAVRDMALTAPCADNCDAGHCTWPYAVQREGGWLHGRYWCPTCRRKWRCGYAVDLPHYLP
jgi:hypothetical protein